jgi:site-specific DNA-methyltransferase (adenine-specific)
MKPYYQDSAITIYHGDCREILPQLRRVDVVLTDPPYAIGEGYDSHGDTTGNLDVLIRDVMPHLFRLSERIAITPGVANVHRYPKPKWILCWTTPAGAGSGPWGFCCWQPVLVYGKDPYLTGGLGRRPDLINHTETSPLNGHPCAKPLKLWTKLMQRISPLANESFLDPFVGSGTTLRAAKDLGRKAIGIEIEEKYCEIAARRMAQEVLALA